jgi:hypothetical protein
MFLRVQESLHRVALGSRLWLFARVAVTTASPRLLQPDSINLYSLGRRRLLWALGGVRDSYFEVREGKTDK